MLWITIGAAAVLKRRPEPELAEHGAAGLVGQPNRSEKDRRFRLPHRLLDQRAGESAPAVVRNHHQVPDLREHGARAAQSHATDDALVGYEDEVSTV